MDGTPIPTGLTRVNDLLDGGLPRGQVTMLTSPFTMMGKTALALTIAHNMTVGAQHRLTYLTLEGKNQDVGDKMLAMATGLDAVDFRRGKVTDEEMARLRQASVRFQRGHLYISDYLQKSVKDIRRDFEDTNSELIVIDYFELLKEARDNPLRELMDLQRIAEEWNMAFLVVVQVRSYWFLVNDVPSEQVLPSKVSTCPQC